MSSPVPNARPDEHHSDAETEQLAVAAVEAIKRLVSERNALRSRVTVLEHELVRLRDHFTLIRDSYRKLANQLITQLQLVDKLDSEVAHRPSKPAELQLASRRTADTVRQLNRPSLRTHCRAVGPAGRRPAVANSFPPLRGTTSQSSA
jgi:hypothetical protein